MMFQELIDKMRADIEAYASEVAVQEFSPKGKLFVIQMNKYFESDRDAETFQLSLKPFEEKLGCTFLILEPGMSLKDPSAPVKMPPEQIEALADLIAAKIRVGKIR